MPKTIGNPLSWAVGRLGAAEQHLEEVAGAVGGQNEATEPVIREIGTEDIRAALRAGLDDFAAFRTDVLFVCLLYPVIGIVLAGVALRGDLYQLLFPIVSGFALVGPVAAVGLYEMSRRRERDVATNWLAALDVVRSPSFGAILVLAVFLIAIFTLWIIVAGWLYTVTLGPEPPTSPAALIGAALGTRAGWAMTILGTAIGFLFAVAALAVSIFSFPMLVDRPVGLPRALVTSVEAARRSPRTVALWGAVVAAALALGSIPLLLGLIIVVPVLGHATWHLYRRAVAWEPAPQG